LKSHDAAIQQLLAIILPIFETLTQTNRALGLSQLNIDERYTKIPCGKMIVHRPLPDRRTSASNHLLPSIYKELMRKKQRQKSRSVPSVLRSRSAESMRLPRTNVRSTTPIARATRARSHSPLPSIRPLSTIETPFRSRFTVDDILVRLAPRLMKNYTGRELTEQIERARTLIPMFLTDEKLTDNEICQRLLQMLMPRGEPNQDVPSTATTMHYETSEERARRVDIDVYHTQISTWEDEMSQIRQRLQNYRTNRLENETKARRTVHFRFDSPVMPENVQIHTPSFEHQLDGFEKISNDCSQAFKADTMPTTDRRNIRLCHIDPNRIKQIELYQRDYHAYLRRTATARTNDFDPCQAINRYVTREKVIFEVYIRISCVHAC
jgi:hypothetical protein